MILFLTHFTIAQNNSVTYLESQEIIFNPERGLQKYTISSDGVLSTNTLNNWKNSSDKVSVVFRYFILPISGNITSTQLSNILTDLNTVRNAGLKIIVRFSYTNSCNSGCLDGTIPQQPSKNQILTHINQLSSIINNNKDVILSIQAGFIGTWGEWYYTGSSEFGHAGSISNTQWQNRKDVVDGMLNNFHIDIPLQVRYVNAKRQMYGNSVPTNFGQDRIGFYNDAFLNSWGDMGTYSISGQFTPPVGSSDYNFIANTSRFLPMTGETNGLNPLRTDGSNAVIEMDNLSFTTLNRDYYTPNWNNWISSNHYNQILRNLGYRFVLNSSTLTGNNLELNISNVGFANILFEKKLFLIFRGSSDIKKQVDYDARNLTKGNHVINLTIPNDIPGGTYELLLQIADKNLETRPEYSIQFANTGLWENSTGYNRLNQSFSACSLTSTWNGTTWVGGVPNQNRVAIINAPYSTEINGSFTCCNLSNNSDVIITSGEYISVVNHIQNNQSLIVQTGGQLIPLNDFTTSEGNITVQRRTTPMKRFDYTYISSPVTTTIGQAVGTWQSNRTYEFVTENFIDIETVFQNGQPSIPQPDGQDDDGDSWLLAPQNLITTEGKGYVTMIRSVPNTPPYPRTELISFTGELNTGVIEYPLKFSGNPLVTNDDFNLVGNPYSAAINANNFIDENINRISGTLAFWTHTGTLSPNYSGLQSNNFSNQDYAYYTRLGGIGTLSSSFGGRIPNNIIGSGQGFIVEAELEENLIFHPNMMSVGYNNSTSTAFFRNTSQTNNNDVRVWLNLHTLDNELFSQQLIGYNSETTKNYEKGWDHKIRDSRMALKFYSFDDNNQKNDIQSRGEFDILDEVNLGYFSAINGEITISLDNIEGLEGVYIKDGDNVCELPYTFYTEMGEFNNRLKLIYTNLLNVNDFNNEVYLIPNPTYGLLQIMNLGDRKVNIYDILFREVNFHIYDNIIDISYLSSGVYYLILDGSCQKIKIIKK
jgi:hypothetical protein